MGGGRCGEFGEIAGRRTHCCELGGGPLGRGSGGDVGCSLASCGVGKGRGRWCAGGLSCVVDVGTVVVGDQCACRWALRCFIIVCTWLWG